MKRTFLLILVGFLLTSSIAFSQDASAPTETQTGSETIAARVNGEIITKETLSAAAGLNQIFQVVFTQLPQGFGTALLSSPEGTAFLDRYQRDVLDRLIDSRLLVQLAKERGIEVDESRVTEQVESHIDQIMQQNQLTLDKIDDILKQQGSSLDEYKENLAKSFREQQMVRGLQDEIVQDAAVSEEEIQAYYAEHKSDYTTADGTTSPIADVHDKIRDTLLQRARSDLWNAWFTEAKDGAQIEILF
jgi:parvulin-like peptidyl-prolyl isomerase